MILLMGQNGRVGWNEKSIGKTKIDAYIRLSFLNITETEDSVVNRTFSWVRRGVTARMRKRLRSTGKLAD